MKATSCLAVAGLFFLFTAVPAFAGPGARSRRARTPTTAGRRITIARTTPKTRALRECRKYSRECTVKKTFRNVCVSVASATNGAMGWAWGYGRSEGNRRAMDECRTNRGTQLQLVERFCTGDADD